MNVTGDSDDSDSDNSDDSDDSDTGSPDSDSDSDSDSGDDGSASADDDSASDDASVVSAAAAMAKVRRESGLADKLETDSTNLEDDGEMVLRLSPETLVHLWAVIGLFLVVNATFCLYKVCLSGSKRRFEADIEAQLEV